VKAHDVLAALRITYCQPEWAMFSEVSDGTGANSRRRADAIAMNMWPSRGLEMRAFEIKVSRSDLKSELKDPAKAEAFAKYCDNFYLVVPKDLITEEMDIPFTWGIITVSNGKCKITKKAVQNTNKVPLTPQFMAGLIRAASKANEAEVQAAIELKTADIRRSEKEMYERLLESRLKSRLRSAETNSELVAKLSETLKCRPESLLHNTDFWHTVRIVQQLGLKSGWSGFSGMQKDLNKVAMAAVELATQLDEHIQQFTEEDNGKES